jgi:2-amino-4-hydroxy-6-hydroxymethyldihydropteridine diphosphokinase
MKTETVVLSLGSNIGSREQHLLEAALRLDQTGGIYVKRLSSLFETEPMGIKTSRQFINACCVIETTLEPGEIASVSRCRGFVRRVSSRALAEEA